MTVTDSLLNDDDYQTVAQPQPTNSIKLACLGALLFSAAYLGGRTTQPAQADAQTVLKWGYGNETVADVFARIDADSSGHISNAEWLNATETAAGDSWNSKSPAFFQRRFDAYANSDTEKTTTSYGYGYYETSDDLGAEEMSFSEFTTMTMGGFKQ